ncbi:MAG: protein TolQ [Gammaproteobacteria bacterium]|nr:protein TolQ [Gammaproteobacteria bacterium]MCW8840133.1 protein TolQ [Gammaproteobacteria bacterium]MCW8959792.1 protein TolQ [Gammaproteobacteria bacterium]MCW8973727.1 protein TolQ [Gammaproteobacteria bacterium]MCW8992830.1 protein TolQ [Gammaproteobacteria bacterium]
MTTEMSIWSLFANASLLVQLVMLLLLAASIYSWTLIIQKYRQLKQAREGAETFENRFWSGIDLVELYKQVNKRRDGLTGMASLFEAGFGEYARLRKQDGLSSMDIVEGAQRAMRVSLSRELDRLEASLAFLATVGSTSPYVGLFGTVWGIMNSFRALGSAQHATLSMVAPGIAEALIATAMGLFAAIPAVIAYNRFSNEVERLDNRYETFKEEFSTLLQRQATS